MYRTTGRSSLVTTRLALVLVAVLVCSILGVSNPATAEATLGRDAFENCLLDRANAARSAAGVGKLEMAHDLVPQVREWSEWMRSNDFEHMPSSRRQDILPDSWTTYGENIAMHSNRDLPDCSSIHSMWMNSPGHRANILDPDFRFVAIGTYVDNSGWWATQLLFDASGYSTTCSGTFCDDDGSSYEQDIEKIAAARITHGCNPPTSNLFCPGDRVTRGEMAAFIARWLDLPQRSGIDFSDDDGSPFEDPIERIAAAGITAGCNPPSNTRFCPNEYVTRGQMAAFLARALDLPPGNSVDFSDDNRSTFEADIERIATAGITLGCNPPSNTRFCPNDHVTRGQMAAFLARALER